MESDSGSPELPAEPFQIRLTPELRETLFGIANAVPGVFGDGPDVITGITTEEQDRIADGEPYCFRCGKPASSFPEYRNMIHEAFPEVTAADYVRDEEGTYNPATNRFACDECYIAIGMPAGPNGWQAP